MLCLTLAISGLAFTLQIKVMLAKRSNPPSSVLSQLQRDKESFYGAYLVSRHSGGLQVAKEEGKELVVFQLPGWTKLIHIHTGSLVLQKQERVVWTPEGF